MSTALSEPTPNPLDPAIGYQIAKGIEAGIKAGLEAAIKADVQHLAAEAGVPVELFDPKVTITKRVIATSHVQDIYSRMVDLRATVEQAEDQLESYKAELRRLYDAGQEVFSAETGEAIFAFQPQNEFRLAAAVAYLQANNRDLAGCRANAWNATKIKAQLTASELVDFMQVKPGTEPKVIVK